MNVALIKVVTSFDILLEIGRWNVTAIILMFYRNPEILNECEIDDETREKLLENIRRRLTPQAVKIRSG